MQPTPGARLLHYRLIAKLGEGGMGVVWKAHDESLDRDVAIKFLPEAYATDPARLERLEREARLLAALNHPGVAQIFGLHSSDGLRFLAMEFVPGETLHVRIRRAPLDVPQALEVGEQLAAALEAAHLAGVVHRDLKPANIVVAPDGTPKVLDFGLGRATADTPAADASLSPTRTTPGTLAGSLLGTAAYMSPEQARGRPVGRDADLWALGCVLYECLTGRPAFDGETVTDTLASVLRNEPDWNALPDDTPLRLRELLRRLLQKDPRRRLRDAGDAALDLAAARDAPATSDPDSTVPQQRSKAGPALVAVAAVATVAALALAGLWLQTPDEPPPRVVRSELEIPNGWFPYQVRISPDGRHLALVAQGREEGRPGWRKFVFLRSLAVDDTFRPIRVPVAIDAVRFSPDSRQVAFVADEVAGVDGPALVRAPADGSAPPSLVVRWDHGWTEDLVWLSPDEIGLVAHGNPQRFLRVPVGGGAPTDSLAVQLDPSQRYLLHSTLPDGSVLGTVESWSGGYHQNVARLDLETGEVTVLADRGFEPAWVPPGRLVFSRSEQLLAADYDVSTRRLTSAPEIVATGLRSDPALTAALFSVSDRGDLVHLPGGAVGRNRQLMWLSRDGTRRAWSETRAAFVPGQIDDSQDGRVIAVTNLGPTGLFEIWGSEVEEPALRRVMVGDAMDCDSPTVSPDGRLVAARCIGDPEHDGIHVVEFPNVGARGRLVLANGEARLYPRSWTPDGRGLFVRRLYGDGGTMLLLPFDEAGEPGEPRAVEGLAGDIGWAMVSPDERLIGFTEWDGRSYVLQVAAWDGEAAGPARPVLRTSDSGFDWTGVVRDGAHEIAVADERSDFKFAMVAPDGRVAGIEDAPAFFSRASDVFGLALLGDGRILMIQADPEEVGVRSVRLITDWARTLDPG